MSDLVDGVRSWLSKSGYPLEMKVARAMHKAGFSVVQSEYFTDPESGKPRETDVVGYSEHRSDTCRIVFALIAECKGDPSKPWVLFTSRDNYPRSLSISRRATSDKGKSILNVLALKEDLTRLPLFAPPERPGYGLAIAHGNENVDVAFAALNSVCKASLGLVSRLENVGEENLIPFAWPVLVVGAPLLEAYLDDVGGLQVERIDNGLLIWRNPVLGKHTLVQVYSVQSFVSEAEDLRKSSLVFAEIAATENDRAPR